jgi:uncharacterized membrane protein YgcG
MLSSFQLDQVYASDHKLENLSVNVFIHTDGSAKITEKRIATLSEGTENYLVIGNLGKSTIKDFVVMEDGETFQYMDNWEIEASLGEKAFKNGIIKTKDGYELCWGIGSYGKHEYIVEYTITNFIKQLQDSQILFWRFVNDQTNIPPENVTIEIETEIDLDENNTRIWSFGFNGQIYFADGKIITTSSEPLDQNDYVTTLVKFSGNLFTTQDHVNKSFDEIKEGAFKGSVYGKKNHSIFTTLSKWIDPLETVLAILFFVVIILFGYFRRSSDIMGKKPKKFKRKFRNEYYRNYPFDGHFSDVYYLLYMMGISNFDNLLTAFILKWINEERITVETDHEGFVRKRKTATIYFLNKEMDNSSYEGILFHMMLSASDSNDILKQQKFATWAAKNKENLMKWEKDLLKESAKKLAGMGYFDLQMKRRLLYKMEMYKITEAGQKQEEKVYQYVNYLHDYSLLDEHEAINVKIWDLMMIWAYLLGLTKVVRKQFKRLYPQYEEETIYPESSLYAIDSFSESVSDARTPDRGSGGGGTTSSGGGGGSYGGGSGGGTR